MERRLAAILAADVVGYTHLTDLDEAGTLARLDGLRAEILDPLIAEHRGRVVNVAGDGFLVEFASVVDAVGCALAWQDAVEGRARQVSEERAIRFRIGVNLGDVMVTGGDLHGHGVNLAVRLEGIAEPGTVLVSRTVANHARGKLPASFEDLGDRELKNIADPVRVFRAAMESDVASAPGQARSGSSSRRVAAIAAILVLLVAAAGAGLWQKPWAPRVELASEADMAFPLPDKPSIAVLPFTNMSGDAEQEYFADGMTEDLITDLSKVSGLFVIASNSSFAYKGQQVKVRQVAEDLGVRYVLEGSVRRVGDQVRINAQLIDAIDGGHLWAERYDSSLDDIFALQDQVTGQIVTALRVNLTPEDVKRRIPAVSSTDAYDAFLHGWTYFRRNTHDDYTKAREYFERAIELDPGYGQAHAALAATYWESYAKDWYTAMKMSRYDTRERAKYYLEKALANPTPLALQVSSKMLVWRGKYEEAVAEARKAAALDANNSDSLVTLAEMLIWSGNPQEAFDPIERARRLDPHNEAYHAYVKGLAEFSLRQFTHASVSLERALGLNPKFLYPAAPLAATYAHLDRLPEARAILKPYCEDVNCQSASSEAHWFPFKNDQVRSQFIDGLVRVGLPE